MTAEVAVATANCVDSAWSKLKGTLLDAVTEVCGPSEPPVATRKLVME